MEFEDVKPTKMKMESCNFNEYQPSIKKEPKHEFHYQPSIKKEPKEEYKVEKYNIKLEFQDVKTERKLDINDIKSLKHEKESHKKEKKKEKKKKKEESKRDKVEPKSREPSNKKKKNKEPEIKDPLLNWNYVKCPQCWIWVKQGQMRRHIERHKDGSPELGRKFARPQRRINIEEKRAESELAAARAREALQLSRAANTCQSSVPVALEEEDDSLEEDSVVGDMFSWSPPPVSSSPSALQSPPPSPSPSWSPLSPR